MIKINLATKKQAAALDGKAGGSGFAAPKLDLSLIKEPAVRKLLIAILVAFLADWSLESFKEEKLAAVRAAVARTQAEQEKLQFEAGKMKDAEKLKVVLEADRAVIKTKLEVMTTLLENRDAPSKMLRIFSTSIPKDTWLAYIRLKGDELSMSGYSYDFSSVSALSKSLSESAFFAEVNPKSSQRTADDANNSIAKFEITGKRR